MNVDVLGLPVAVVTREELVAAAEEMLRGGGGHHLVALNPLKVMAALRDPALAATIRRAALVFCDGHGIAWAVKRLHGVRAPVIPGCELMEDLLRLADRDGRKIFLVGGRPEVLPRMRRRLEATLPRVRLAGAEHGYFPPERRPALIREILEARPDLLLVGMGAGRQEALIAEVEAGGGLPVMMGVGGSFDAYVGAVRRPPRFVRRVGLEWLWRALRQPSRFPRLLVLPEFVRRVLAARRAVSPDPGRMPPPCAS